MFEKKPKRMAVKQAESHNITDLRIIVDRQTGVNYLVVSTPNGVSVTPLLDANGQVVHDKPDTNWENEFYDR